jgi:hypothetical protein
MMERSESTFEQLELKYCERGGGYGCGARTRSECIAGPAFRDGGHAGAAKPRAARWRIPPLDPDIKSCALELYGVVEGGQS